MWLVLLVPQVRQEPLVLKACKVPQEQLDHKACKACQGWLGWLERMVQPALQVQLDRSVQQD
jgi:hypothetical protein